MKLFITGAEGQLGSELQRQLREGSSVLGIVPPELSGAEILASKHSTLDICDESAVKKTIRCFHPDVVFHCAAITDVDGCESSPELVMRVNGEAVRNIAEACEQIGAKLVYISTDYVFSGEKGAPYREDDACDPRTVYGRGKYLGERNAIKCCSRTFVVRTAWLYGRCGKNFVATILRKSSETDELRIVNDQVGNPTNAEDLVWHLLRLAATEAYGIYHCSGKGVCSWYDFGRAIVEMAGIECRIRPCSTDEYPHVAHRPAYSVLDHGALEQTIGDYMRPWQSALKDFIMNLQMLEEKK